MFYVLDVGYLILNMGLDIFSFHGLCVCLVTNKIERLLTVTVFERSNLNSLCIANYFVRSRSEQDLVTNQFRSSAFSFCVIIYLFENKLAVSTCPF